jgi:hypothetical protein
VLGVMSHQDTSFRLDRIDMGKQSLVVIIIIACAIAADQYWNYGFYTDGTLRALHQIRHSFGW